MTDDAETYAYVYDAWGRLVEVEHRSTASTIARYRYNALGQRIGWQIDTDADGTVETTGSDDPWTYALYNERWQLLGEHIADDGTSGAGAADDPDRLFVNHLADASYIDSMILVDSDTAPSGGDGVLEERTYYVQNWRHDVVALAESDGDLVEQTEYGLYGNAIDLLRADFDKDGDVDLGDFSVFGAQSPTADCSGSGGCTADFDLDGDVDGDDTAIFNAEFGEKYKDTVDISLHARAHGRGYAGYVMDDAVAVYHVRHRVYRPDLGKWTKRDPLGYVDGGSLYGYVGGNAVTFTDHTGMYKEYPPPAGTNGFIKCTANHIGNTIGVGPISIRWVRKCEYDCTRGRLQVPLSPIQQALYEILGFSTGRCRDIAAACHQQTVYWECRMVSGVPAWVPVRPTSQAYIVLPYGCGHAMISTSSGLNCVCNDVRLYPSTEGC